MISGNLVDVPNDALTENVLGAYLPWQNAQLLEPPLRIPVFHRGQLMKVGNTVGSDPMAKYMWFVRLRASTRTSGSPTACCTPNAPGCASRANASARLIDERLPVSFRRGLGR